MPDSFGFSSSFLTSDRSVTLIFFGAALIIIFIKFFGLFTSLDAASSLDVVKIPIDFLASV